jgi:hypothetical protein
MSLHDSTFDYVKPTDDQMNGIVEVRRASKEHARVLASVLPEGPDKTYVLRMLRTVNMWAMIALTRHPDGAPRN